MNAYSQTITGTSPEAMLLRDWVAPPRSSSFRACSVSGGWS